MIAKDKNSYFPSPNTVLQPYKNYTFEDRMFLLCGTPPCILREYSGTWRIVNDTLILTQNSIRFDCKGFKDCKAREEEAKKQIGLDRLITLRPTS